MIQRFKKEQNMSKSYKKFKMKRPKHSKKMIK